MNVSDAAAALQCIEAVIEFADADVATVTVKNANGDVLMVLNVDALRGGPK